MNNDTQNKPVKPKDKKLDKKEQDRRETENFKRKYFDYYDDIKTSVKQDW